MEKGKFIVFEGGDGSGKSTVLEMVYNHLKERGIDCIKTREPGGIKISEDIRSIILDTKNTEMDGRTEALLYAAARRQHLVEKVIVALNEGKVVLCDRFIYSSLAYQGYARGLGIDDVFEINKFAIGEYMPDLTILFDITPEVGLERINKNSTREINRLDLEKIDFHHKVRDGYEILYQNNKEKIIKINAEKTLEEVFEEVKNVVLNRVL
ncbi:dTMP kinase [Clostridium chauvoei]|uniref:Thymidylate kinase n=2 Tax=Clostridium chauvoei TaxID=46867 RepID=S6F2X0_9CLOT|nr:dTMP kinase [Clostridium chauvoei]ATD53896.1 dTMP kinase [Clostridium chauvoei]ATD58299.1 dTMP kinase [Clostridium chauvoei]MBX7280540.1 dTMP kinase [Clostridium chauvoei]MBX7283132.1 dTMP kinase [Clostridium chauvoei]MBX7285338.1 dTMP kinase [Clostridium chauvoei]